MARWMRLALWLGLAAAAAGCAQPGVDPGPDPARLEMDLKARVAPAGRAWNHYGPQDVRWDWGVYLVGREGRLLPVGSVSGRRMKVLSGNPLERQETFLLPPGRQQVRVELEAYYFRPHAEGHLPVSLGFWRREFSLALGAGQKEAVSLSLGPQR